MRSARIAVACYVPRACPSLGRLQGDVSAGTSTYLAVTGGLLHDARSLADLTFRVLARVLHDARSITHFAIWTFLLLDSTGSMTEVTVLLFAQSGLARVKLVLKTGLGSTDGAVRTTRDDLLLDARMRGAYLAVTRIFCLGVFACAYATGARVIK